MMAKFASEEGPPSNLPVKAALSVYNNLLLNNLLGR
jgi:hypothetical protein